MRVLVPALFLLLAGCGNGPTSRLPAVGQARTSAAEWAMVNDLAERGKLSRTYTEQMREAVHDELVKTVGQTQTDSPEWPILLQLLAEPPDAAPALLRGQADRLKSIETALESA